MKRKRKKVNAVLNRKLVERRDERYAAEFERYRNLARKIASKFADEYNQPYLKMVEVAEYALAMELFGRRKYDAGHDTKKSTWLYAVVYFHMKQVCTRGLHPCPAYEGMKEKVHVREWWQDVPFSCVRFNRGDAEEREFDPPAEDMPRMRRILQELSEEAQALVGIILEIPGEIAVSLRGKKVNGRTQIDHFKLDDTIRNRKKAEMVIKAYLIDELDWPRAQVDRAWKEVQASLESN